MQTRDQRLATSVYEHVSTVDEKDKTYQDEYGSMAHKLPVLIRTAGLAQAIAFVQARGKDAHKDLLNHLARVIDTQDGATLAQRSREASLHEYMYLTQHALAALLWYKRFAQSVLGVESSDVTEGSK
jgi:CRISPR-associated protein Cmr5